MNEKSNQSASQAASEAASQELEQVRPALPNEAAQPAAAPATPLPSLSVYQQTTLFIGPLPAPADLQHYEQIEKGLAGRIVSMAESAQQARQQNQQFYLHDSAAQAYRGQVFAFLSILMAFGCATYLGLNGHDWLGGVFVGATLVTIVSAFLRNERAKREERERRQAQNTTLLSQLSKQTATTSDAISDR